MHRVFRVALATSLALTSCGGDSDPKALPTPAAPAPGAPAPAPPPAQAAEPAGALPAMKVTLLEAGTAPQRQLRLHLKAGSKGTYVLTQTQKAISGTAGGPVVTDQKMLMLYDAEVTSVGTDGLAAVSMSVHDLKVEFVGLPNPDPATFAGLRLGFKGRIAPGGTWTGAKFTVDADPSGKMRTLMEQVLGSMEQSIQQMSVPLPEEAVGVGARWTVEGAVTVMGMSIGTKSEVRVESIAGDVVRLVTSTHGSVADQTMSMPTADAAAPMKIDVKEMTVESEGTSTMDLGQVLPVALQVTSKTETRLQVKATASTPATDVESKGESVTTIERKE